MLLTREASVVSKALTNKNGTIASKNGDLYRFIVDLCWRSWLITHMMIYGNLHDELEGEVGKHDKYITRTYGGYIELVS